MGKTLKDQVEEIREKLANLKEKKISDKQNIERRITEERLRVQISQDNLDKAIREMDEKNYKKYKAETADARDNLELYEARYKQIGNIEYVTEAESDEVFNILLKYEDELEADFEEKFGVVLQELKKIYEPYFEEAYATEELLREWEHDIKRNFRHLRKDENGNYYGNRENYPIAVHNMAFTGADRANKLRDFVEGCESENIAFY